MKINKLKNEKDLRLHLENNLMSGKSPVAICVCPDCGEIATGELLKCENKNCKRYKRN